MRRFRTSATLFAWLGLAACAGTPAARPASGQQAVGGDLLYVCNQDAASVSIIDVARLEVVQTIRLQDLGFTSNAKPHHVAVEPDGSIWYLTLIGENRILKFDRQNRLLGQAEFETPGLLALAPGGDRLFVGRSMSAVNPPRRIGVIRPSDMRIDEIDIVFPQPHLLDIRPAGDFVYSASLGVNQLASVAVATDRVTLLPQDGPNHAMAHSAISPDGRMLAVTPHMPHVQLFDLSDPARPALAASIDVGEMPWHPVFTPDGRFLYVPNQGSNDLSVIDMGSRTVVATIRHDAFAQPYGSAVTPDGRYVFVSNSNSRATWPGTTGTAGATGNVVVIDTRSREVVRVIEVGRGPTGLGIRKP